MNTADLFTRYVLDRHAIASTPTPGKSVDLTDQDDAQPQPVEAAYPQVIVMQGRQRPEWLGDHAGNVLAYAGLGVLALAALAIVALVAVAVALAAITSTVAVVAIRAIAASSQSHGRWSR